MLANPYRLAESQMNLWWNYMSLWQASTMKLLGGAADPVATPGKGDKRFRHEDWEEHFLFDYIKQSYLIAAHWLHDAVGNVEGLDDATKRKVELLHAAVHRRARAVEFRADQSGGVPRDDRDRRPEPRQGPPQPARRHRARQRPAQDLDDRPEGLRARRQHRDHAGQGRLPERPPAAHPVRADDAEGREAAAARHSAVDQQVLHPRSAREELVREVGGRPGPHRVRHLLGQSRRAARAQGFRGLPDRGHARRARRDREGDRREGGQRDRLLPRRHAARRDARLHGGEQGQADRQRDVHDVARRFHARPASSRCSSTRSRSPRSSAR